MGRSRRAALAGRIPRLSVTFHRSLRALGITRGSSRDQAVSQAVRALATADVLPGPNDIATAFGASQVHVRRVQGANLWLLYSVDAEHVHLITVRDEPPVPSDDE